MITQNVHAKSQATVVKDERQQQAESLVVSVPLPATVPGINLPTSSNSNSSNNISTIVTSSQSQQSSSASPHPAHGGTLYQHLTNSSLNSHRSSPLISSHQNIIQHHSGIGRQSPHTSSLAADNSSMRSNTPNSNHQSVLQNLSSSPSVISNSIHGPSSHSATETTLTTGMLKITYEKQPSGRVASLMQEEAVSSGRRSR